MSRNITNRRRFIKRMTTAGGIVLVGSTAIDSPKANARTAEIPQAGMDSIAGRSPRLRKILERIKPPEFPAHRLELNHFGAIGDGRTDCTEAFEKSMKACHAAGGGTVALSSGVYLTGAIHFKSNVNLHVPAGAEIRFIQNLGKYLPVVYTRFEGIECMNYSPFIYAYGETNIAITGAGTINGQGNTPFWQDMNRRQEHDRAALLRMGEEHIPVEQRVFGKGHQLRPNMIEFYRCKNVFLHGVTLRDSPMWTIHPVLSKNVIVSDVSVISYGINSDGCDPECSEDVWIKNCYFATRDDCIAIKSGKGPDGRRVNVPSRNIVVQDCRMELGLEGGIAVGSETSGGINNVFVSNCKMNNLEKAVYIKTNTERGGVIRDFHFDSLDIEHIEQAIIDIDMNYGYDQGQGETPIVCQIDFSNLRCYGSKRALVLRGLQQSPIRRVVLEKCVFDNVASPNLIEHVKISSFANVVINGKASNRPVNSP